MQNADIEGEDEGSVLSWYRQIAHLRASRDELLAGSWEELMDDSEEVFAFQRVLSDARSVTLVNWTTHEVEYDAALVEGLDLVAGSHGAAEPGTLRPLEATIWATKA